MKSTTPCRILLIEDNEGHARLIMRSFEEHGSDMLLIHADSLRKAREYLAADPFDLIISDIVLPDGNGQDIIDETETPKVFMTSHGDEQHAVELIKSGALDYIPKNESTLLSMATIARRALKESQYLQEKRHAEKQLRENERKFRGIFETAPDLMLALDEQGLILNCNSRAVEITGYHAGELAQRPLLDFIVDEYRDGVRRVLNELNKLQVIHRNEFELIRKDGTLFFASGSYSVIRDENGAIGSIIATLEDISGHKQALRALATAKEQAEKVSLEKERINRQLEESMMQANWMAIQADAANKAKSQFLANMSHEIRTPLNTILGFIDVLSNERLTATQQGYVDTIRVSAANLTTIINDILDLSKIEAGKLHIEKSAVKLDDILHGIEAVMTHTAANKGLDFQVIRQEPLPEIVHTDPTRLKQCLINLIGNALKFTATGFVHVVVSQERFDGGPVLHFAVKDSGIGIPIDKQRLIFDAFSQADGSITRQYGGTGLGLNITKRLATMLGGDVSLVSMPAKGSTFTLTIPWTKEAATAQPLPDRPAEPAATRPESLKGLVLVAEDNLSNQMLMKVLLRKIGLECIVVNNGAEACAVAANQRFDLILMDIQMPVMSGLEAARILRQKGIATPIIALTAHAFESNSQKSLDSGCNDHLAKPIDYTTLKTTLAKYLSPQTPAQPLPLQKTEVKTEIPRVQQMVIPNTTSRTEDFLRQLPERIESIRSAFSSNDLKHINTVARIMNISSNEAGLGQYAELFTKLQQLTIEENNLEIEKVIEHLTRMRQELAYHLDKPSV